MIRKYVSWLAFAFAAFSFQTVSGVVFHPSVPDDVKKNFRERVKTEVRSVGYLFTGTGSCTAQPITSQVLITAAHCTNSKTIEKGWFGWDVDNDGFFEGSRRFSSFVDHPGWSNDGRKSRPLFDYVDDIALIFLSDPLPNHLAPYRIRTVAGTPIGAPVIVGGYGRQGTIDRVVKNGDFGTFDKQYATNVIDGIIYGKILRTDLSNRVYPGVQGTPGSSNPEGLIAPGDSGGGVFTSTNFSVFNYSHTVFNFPIKLTTNFPELIAINSNGDAHHYGAEAGYVFLAPHYSWIKSTIEAAGLSDEAPRAGGSTMSTASITPVSFSQQIMSAEPPQDLLVNVRIDKFPEFSVASQDSDNDGYPDYWNEGSTEGAIALSGLKLDAFPFDPRYAADDDSDGLDDNWERNHFGSLEVTDGSQDADIDGHSNLEEWMDGTDPNNASSGLNSLTPGTDFENYIGRGDAQVFVLEPGDDIESIEVQGTSGEPQLQIFSLGSLDSTVQVCEGSFANGVVSCVGADLPASRLYVRILGPSRTGTTFRLTVKKLVFAPPPVHHISSPVGEGLPFNLEFAWYAVNDAAAYQLKVIDLHTEETILHTDWLDAAQLQCNVAGELCMHPATYEFSGEYLWQIQTRGAGGVGDWSPTFNFSTLVVPATPVPISPESGVDSAVDADQPIAVAFSPVANASRYHVKVFDRAGKKTSYSNERVMPSVCSGNTCTISVPGLAVQERAAWWVRAVNQAGWGVWSAPVFFDVEQALSIPATPTRIAPVDGDTVFTGDSLQLSFTPVANASHYHVRVFDRVSGEFSYSNERVMPSVCSGTTCTISVPGLPVQERAAWWVRAVNDAGWRRWSSPAYFDVKQVVSKPVAPSQIAPSAGSVVSSVSSIEISFTPVANASRYHVKVFDRAGKKVSYSNERVLPSVCGVSKCTIFVPGLPVQERAAWWVRAVNQAGWGAWSAPVFFDVEQAVSVPAIPASISPAEGDALISGSALELSFAPVADATHYQVKVFDRVAGEVSYSDEYVMPSVCSGDTCTISVPGLPAQERAAWWVRAVNEAGFRRWGTPTYFDVKQAVSKPMAPAQIAPSTGSVVSSGSSIEISFAPVANASRYHVKVFDRAGKKVSYSNERVMPTVCSGATCTVSVPGLPVQERAAWWVRAVNQTGWGAWSGPVFFDAE